MNSEVVGKIMFFRVDFLGFGACGDDCWWFSVLNIHNFFDFNRSLLHVERYKGGQWIIHLMFMKITG